MRDVLDAFKTGFFFVFLKRKSENNVITKVHMLQLYKIFKKKTFKLKQKSAKNSKKLYFCYLTYQFNIINFIKYIYIEPLQKNKQLLIKSEL